MGTTPPEPGVTPPQSAGAFKNQPLTGQSTQHPHPTAQVAQQSEEIDEDYDEEDVEEEEDPEDLVLDDDLWDEEGESPTYQLNEAIDGYIGFSADTSSVEVPLKLYTASGKLATYLYSQSLLLGDDDFAVEIANQLTSITNLVHEHESVGEFLDDPTNTKTQKRIFFKAIYKAAGAPTPTLASFIDQLVESNQVQLLGQVAEDFLAILRASAGTVDVAVTLASASQAKPDPDTVRQILRYSPYKTLNLHFQVDPKIGGGAILESDSRYIDLSFQKELEQLRDTLAAKQRAARDEKRNSFYKLLAQVERGEVKDVQVEDAQLKGHEVSLEEAKLFVQGGNTTK